MNVGRRKNRITGPEGLVILALLAFSAAASARIGDAELGAILGTRKADPSPGCVMAVYRQGRMERFLGDAVADLATGVRVNEDTQFYAASISKQFTALAVVQLHLAGKLGLDDDIREWIPELPEYGSVVTPRMLLQHQSGILDSLSLVSLVHGPGNAGNVDRSRTLALVLAQTDTNFKPGTAVLYSNGGYLLLSELVGRASGMKFADYVRVNILQPLGMHDSYVLDGEPKASGKLARGYVRNGDGWERKDTFPRYGGSGGLMLTLNDLSRYEYDIVEGKRIWTPEVRTIMEAPGRLADGSPAIAGNSEDSLVHAMGLQVGQRNGRRVVEHGGSADAFQHMYTRIPDRELAVATFCNIGNSNAKGRAIAALELLLGTTDEKLDETSVPLAGVYRSATLPVRYVVRRLDDDAIEVVGIPDGSVDASFRAKLSRDSEGNSFRGDGITVQAMDDGSGSLMIGTARARPLRAERVEPGFGK